MGVGKEVTSVTREVAKQEMKPVLTVSFPEVMITKTGYGVKIAKVVKWKR